MTTLQFLGFLAIACFPLGMFFGMKIARLAMRRELAANDDEVRLCQEEMDRCQEEMRLCREEMRR